MNQYTIYSPVRNETVIVIAKDEKKARSEAMKQIWDGVLPHISNEIGAGLHVMDIKCCE